MKAMRNWHRDIPKRPCCVLCAQYTEGRLGYFTQLVLGKGAEGLKSRHMVALRGLETHKMTGVRQNKSKQQQVKRG